MKLFVEVDEACPVYSLDVTGRPKQQTIKLSRDEWRDYQRVEKAYWAWQRRVADLVGPSGDDPA